METMSGDGIATFTVGLTRYLASDGTPLAAMPEVASDVDRLHALYRGLILTRAFDTRAIALQRTGRLGTFASSLGQEAVSVGAASAMAADDVLVPSFREQGAQLWRGVTPVEMLLYWAGDERGSDFAGPRDDFPICVPVGSQVPHAAGVALAMKLRKQARAVLCVIGDGGTSKGDFYEAINMAGVWTLPLVVLINNNQWAISVPRSAQSAAQTLAQKAIAAGIPGQQVDGNDVIAVHDVVANALHRARTGQGACVIEALTYRLTDHTTADDASRYRDDAEVAAHWRDEPIARLRHYLVSRDMWSREDEEQALAQAAETMERAAEAYLATPPQPVSAMFDHVFAQMPASLRAQRDRALVGEPDDA